MRRTGSAVDEFAAQLNRMLNTTVTDGRLVQAPGSRYPAAHVHVNATFRSQRAAAWIAKTAGHLHLPTERVPLESVVWHAIAEWGAEPRAGDWRERLGVSIAGFRARERVGG